MSTKKLIVGIDEVGIGCIAGPIVIAAVALRRDYVNPLIRDSKKVSKAKMLSVCSIIHQDAVWRKCLSLSVRSIDRLGTWVAWERGVIKLVNAALSDLGDTAEILIDGVKVPPLVRGTVKAIKGGDALNVSISAASVIAKSYRDRYMIAKAEEHPAYGWERNMGYPTKEHTAALMSYGMTPLHRAVAAKTCRLNCIKKENT